VFSFRGVPGDKVHLAGKPIDLLVELLAVTPGKGTVLDPFLGGGTTALACIKTGRRFVGVELSPEYYRVAGDQIRTACDAAQGTGKRSTKWSRRGGLRRPTGPA
jgi:site-specific DNA-methyltransferase (adenine-specific)